MAALPLPRSASRTRRRCGTSSGSSQYLLCPRANACAAAVLRSRRVLHPLKWQLGPALATRSLHAISEDDPETTASVSSAPSQLSSDVGDTPATAHAEDAVQPNPNPTLSSAEVPSIPPLNDASHLRSHPKSFPRPNSRRPNSSTSTLPPYADAMVFRYIWPRFLPSRDRPPFLNDYPVPSGKLYNVNSFLGRREVHNGQFLVPQESYRTFIVSYVEALEAGYSLFLTENYHQQVYKYFIELDWPWDADLGRVMEVTPKLIDLIIRAVSDFYRFPSASTITSIRTPYKIHLNFPQLLTTELLAGLCRDRILEVCRTELGPMYSDVDWERLIDFPHGSLRMMGSRKAPYMDSDPAWVADKAYHPAKLVGGKWCPGRITVGLMLAASIFPTTDQVAAFERSPAYLDMIYGDLEACKKKVEERRERQRRKAERALSSSPSTLPGSNRPFPPGSSKDPLRVTFEVRKDETVAINVYVKMRFRNRVSTSKSLQQPQQEGVRENLDNGTMWVGAGGQPSASESASPASLAASPAGAGSGTGAGVASAAKETAAVGEEEVRVARWETACTTTWVDGQGITRGEDVAEVTTAPSTAAMATEGVATAGEPVGDDQPRQQYGGLTMEEGTAAEALSAASTHATGLEAAAEAATTYTTTGEEGMRRLALPSSANAATCDVGGELQLPGNMEMETASGAEKAATAAPG